MDAFLVGNGQKVGIGQKNVAARATGTLGSLMVARAATRPCNLPRAVMTIMITIMIMIMIIIMIIMIMMTM